jgi:Geminivirus Rep catalytic domain
LTYPRCGVSQGGAVEQLKTRLAEVKGATVLEYVAAREEHGERSDQPYHLHVYLKLDRAVRFNPEQPDLFDLCEGFASGASRTRHPNIQGVRNRTAWIRYCVKQDEAYVTNITPDKLEKLIEKDGATPEERSRFTREVLSGERTFDELVRDKQANWRDYERYISARRAFDFDQAMKVHSRVPKDLAKRLGVPKRRNVLLTDVPDAWKTVQGELAAKFGGDSFYELPGNPKDLAGLDSTKRVFVKDELSPGQWSVAQILSLVNSEVQDVKFSRAKPGFPAIMMLLTNYSLKELFGAQLETPA